MRRINKLMGIIWVLFLFFCAMSKPSLAISKEGISLETALRMALENPNNLGPSSAALDEAQAQLDKTTASRWPSVSLNGKYTQIGPHTTIDMTDMFVPGPDGKMIIIPPMPKRVGATDSYSTGFSLQWPLYMGGKLTSAVNLARFGLESAEEDYQADYEDLVCRVIQAYIGFLKADRMLALSQEQIKLLTEHQRLVETNLDLGYAAKNDLLETKIRLTQAELGAVKAEHGKRLAAENLSNLLGASNQELVLTSQPTISPDHTLPGLEEALRQAEQGRPELKNLETVIKIAEENYKMSRGYWRPDLVMIGTYGTQNQKSFTLEDAVWSFTLNLDWKLFDAGAGQAGVREAEANLRRLNHLLAQSREMINLEVRQKYLAATEAYQVLELTKLSRSQAEENYQFMKTKFELGAATNLELLSANNTLNMALNESLNAEYDYYLAVSGLYKVMGQTEEFILEVSEDA